MRLPPDAKRRATGMVLALLVQLLLVALLLTLSPRPGGGRGDEPIFIGVNIPAAKPQPETPPETAETPSPSKQPVQPTPPVAAPPEPSPTPPVAEPPPVITLPPEVMATLAISPPPPPPRASGPLMGPPAPKAIASDDTPLVSGSGPNGEPLFAAAWYREPYDDELRGYLSTARGTGWGQIACRTVSGFRVEDCIILGEYPEGSGIARAIQAAAWQFRVRPPRKGGHDLVGEWVRIHIDYGLKRRKDQG